jgi:hypothetical protein
MSAARGTAGPLVAIHQPNYLPWLGYFHKIATADIFVFLDDVQYSKGSYTNRVAILERQQSSWLSVPVRVSLGQSINQIELAKDTWRQSHADRLFGAYRKAPAFAGVWEEVRQMLIDGSGDDLAASNINLTKTIATRLGLDCLYVRSSELQLKATSDERLVEILSVLAPTGTYLSGKGAAKYQDPKKFERAGLGFRYSAFAQEPYSQDTAQFVPGLSILDAVFHLGWVGAAGILRGPVR